MQGGPSRKIGSRLFVRGGSRQTQDMLAVYVAEVNKIIIRYRSNGEGREVAES